MTRKISQDTANCIFLLKMAKILLVIMVKLLVEKIVTVITNGKLYTKFFIYWDMQNSSLHDMSIL